MLQNVSGTPWSVPQERESELAKVVHDSLPVTLAGDQSGRAQHGGIRGRQRNADADLPGELTGGAGPAQRAQDAGPSIAAPVVRVGAGRGALRRPWTEGCRSSNSISKFSRTGAGSWAKRIRPRSSASSSTLSTTPRRR